MSFIEEGDIESIALKLLKEKDWHIVYGPDIAPGASNAERNEYRQVVLEDRLHTDLNKLNPHLPSDALNDALRKLLLPAGSTLEVRNRAFHRMLIDGVTVEFSTDDGAIRSAQVQIINYEDPTANDWLAVNQFTVREGQYTRRPDIVLFLNGLPLGILELKNPADENATIQSAWNQLQTYKAELPTLFALNEFLMVSDGTEARIGTLSAGWEWFKPWRTLSDIPSSAKSLPELQVMLEAVCNPEHFLKMLRDFIVFADDDSGALAKLMAGYHQFHAVQTAVAETLRAATPSQTPTRNAKPPKTAAFRHNAGGNAGDRRIGVVWHTQGSGKSLTMAFFAGAIIREPAMANPTIVVLTDRNDLDDQLFGTFSRCQDLLRQPPAQAESRTDLRRRLSVAAGGVVFTTIQKFLPETKGDHHPLLSNRSNIVVIADEAHRSQYDFIDGFARHMRDALPQASFIGFTGTPIELQDANTRAVFGDYISVYDIQRAVEDKATVPIYYESRLARLALEEDAQLFIDEEFESATEGEEIERQEKLKTKWAQLEALVGTETRLKFVAEDIVSHFERRLEVLKGKAMVVCMSRRICIDLYRWLASLRPDWHSEEDDQGQIKIVMTGSASDPPEWQSHIRNKARREALALRFRDAADPFHIVLVRDMWLTGFDAPSLHTMYIDKPMRGHGLMQAIARVNRVFQDKPGGLIVDYLGLAQDLRRSLSLYTQSGGRGQTAIDQDEAVSVMREKYEICQDLFYGFDWSQWRTGSPQEKLGLLPAAQEHILIQEDGKNRCLKAVRDLTQAFTLAVPHEEALGMRDDVGFFQTVRAALAKRAANEVRAEEELDHAIRQIVSRAVVSEGVMDIFSAAGLTRPDVSVLSDDFLEEVKNMPQRNLAAELLRKLLKNELATRSRKNAVQARSFGALLEEAIRRYQSRAIGAAQVIEELIQLARDLRAAHARGAELGLTDDELAFYDALETNASAVRVLGDATLCEIARELVETVQNNVTLDWVDREQVRARLRVLVRRILRRNGYPPDRQEKATRTVLEQAELLSEGWVLG